MTTANLHLEIRHANGEANDHAASMDVTEMMLQERYGEDVVIQEDWESDGPDGERKLVWANETDADNDNGSKAVAEITRRPRD